MLTTDNAAARRGFVCIQDGEEEYILSSYRIGGCFLLANGLIPQHRIPHIARITRIRRRAGAPPGTAQFRSRGHLALETVDPAAAEQTSPQRQVAADIRVQEQHTIPRNGTRTRSGYLPSEDRLLQALRLEGLGYRQIKRAKLPSHINIQTSRPALLTWVCARSF